MDKLSELKKAIELLEGQDLDALKRALALVGEPVDTTPSYEDEDPSSQVKIVVLQRGWVVVGKYSQTPAHGRLDNAAVIRFWGTTKGLGELALGGPTDKTKLDPCGTVKFERLTTVLMLDVKDDALWFKKLS